MLREYSVKMNDFLLHAITYYGPNKISHRKIQSHSIYVCIKTWETTQYVCMCVLDNKAKQENDEIVD